MYWYPFNPLESKPGPCPQCGHCPTCGRSAWSLQPPLGAPWYTIPGAIMTTDTTGGNPGPGLHQYTTSQSGYAATLVNDGY